MTRRDRLHHFSSAEGDELVDHDLRAVGEIAELRLPDHQGVGPLQAVAVFEAQHRVFRQRAVERLEPCLPGVEPVQPDMLVAADPVDQAEMPVREGAAHDVLPAEPHGHAVQHRAAERHRFGERPCDAPRLGRALAQDASHAGVQRRTLGRGVISAAAIRARVASATPVCSPRGAAWDG